MQVHQLTLNGSERAAWSRLGRRGGSIHCDHAMAERSERTRSFSARLCDMDTTPETRFARRGRDRIAYQVFGEGPPDLLCMSCVGDCIDFRWEYPPFALVLAPPCFFSRVIMFDRRGIGASDPVSLEELPTWEEWANDALAVLDEVGSERAAVLGQANGGPIAVLFAAAHPDRTQALIVANAWVRSAQDLVSPSSL